MIGGPACSSYHVAEDRGVTGTEQQKHSITDLTTQHDSSRQCVVRSNSHLNSSTYPQNCAGVGLYPKGALINHSSTPNTMQTFQGQQICFQALQPVQEGTEVTISYIELAATRAERCQQLMELYYFDMDAHLVSHLFWFAPLPPLPNPPSNLISLAISRQATPCTQCIGSQKEHVADCTSPKCIAATGSACLTNLLLLCMCILLQGCT